MSNPDLTIIEALDIPNLGALGVPSAVPKGDVDLQIIWLTPYPVITRYLLWCRAAGLRAFGGGTRQEQGSAWIPGHILSGYRPYIVGTNKESPHRYAIALDVAVGKLVEQIEKARAAVPFFTRIGLYPGHGFIHLDLAPETFIKRHRKRRFWIKRDYYVYYDTSDELFDNANRLLEGGIEDA